jgi:hypothetical protein
MKTAKLPGFTAETSIYNSTVTYRSLSAGAGIGSTSVVPALVEEGPLADSVGEA